MYTSPLADTNAGNTFGFQLSGAWNPSVVATAGPVGALFLLTVAPISVWQKQDNGVTTNWLKIAGSGAGGGIGIASVGSLAAPLAVTVAGINQVGLPATNYDFYITGSGGPVVVNDPPLVLTNCFLGQIVTIFGGANAVTFQDEGPGSDWFCNGNTVLGAQQVLVMKCVKVISAVAGTADWSILSKQP